MKVTDTLKHDNIPKTSCNDNKISLNKYLCTYFSLIFLVISLNRFYLANSNRRKKYF